MAGYAGFSMPQNPPLTMLGQVDTIWEMGVTSLFSNNNQLVLPLYMAETLGEDSIIELRSRLSQIFGSAPTTVTKDTTSNVLRIGLASQYSSPPAAGMPYASPPPTTPSPQSTTSAAAVAIDSNLRSPGKKAKVPRPPNAFILYRKEHHPLLKAKEPDMHNNEISIILGKQWKSEPEQAKNKYRAHARIIKKLHAAENPGYQYAPRKPSEKKRRMTARKLVRIQAAAKEDGQSFPANGMSSITDQEQYESDDIMAVDESSEEDVILPSAHPTPSAAGVLGVKCPPVRGDIAGPSYDGEMSVLMPTSRQDFGNFQQQFNNHLAPAQQYGHLSFDAYNRETMAADGAQHNMNDQDFLNSLINWDGIQADAELIHQMVADNRAELATAEVSGSSLLFADDAAAKFQAELDRVSKMM